MRSNVRSYNESLRYDRSKRQKMFQACRGELEKLELMAEIPLLKKELLIGGRKADRSRPWVE